MKPSQYLAESQLQIQTHATPPEIVSLNNKHSALPLSQTLFSPTPSSFSFQNWQPFNSYKVTLQFINNDRVPRSILIKQVEHPLFKVKRKDGSDGLGFHSVAPGIIVYYVVEFNPVEDIDAKLNLVVETDREVFLIPIFAKSTRGSVLLT